MKALLATARDEGVSLGSRGNLLILAPPLVVTESQLSTALGVLDRLLARFFPASLERAS
jgi:taurine--2-oxoglutarate transaminase